ncbi:hypothetical protein JTB14_028047 [Gonioctena quinquepunctata]|nr:hypothetical protein JTB14_028047 [Gonioctena quinquepunctata]
MDKYRFTASQVWNVDKTAVSTVLKSNKIVAAKGKREVCALTSGKRASNFEMITAASASGNTVPPMFVFFRKNIKSLFVIGGPPDSIGGKTIFDFMTDEIFEFLQKRNFCVESMVPTITVKIKVKFVQTISFEISFKSMHSTAIIK